MLRSWIRTSDACRTALEIAYGAQAHGNTWQASSQNGRSARPSSNDPGSLASPVKIEDSTPDVQASPSTGATAVATSIANTKQIDSPEETYLGDVSTGAVESGRPGQPSYAEVASPSVNMRSSAVPSSRFARLFQYGGRLRCTGRTCCGECFHRLSWFTDRSGDGCRNRHGSSGTKQEHRW